MSAEIRYRRATMGDYQAVMDIDTNVYDGLDYLPAIYAWILQSSKTMAVVALEGGKVIGHCYAFVGDDGPSMTGGGGRVHARYQGSPVFPGMLDFLHREMKEKHANVVQRLGISLGSRQRRARLAKHRDILRVEDQWKVEFSVFTTEVLCKFLANSTVRIDVHQLSPREISAMIDDIKSVLSAEKRYFLFGVMWLPLEITEGNIRYAARMSNLLGSLTNGLLTSVSFAAYTTLQRGYLGVLFYTGSSTDECIEHIARFMQMFHKVIGPNQSDRVATEIHYAHKLDSEQIQTYIRASFGAPFQVSHYDTKHGGEVMLEIEVI